jgi:5-methylcytosine-specific restriction endonuclease McrA
MITHHKLKRSLGGKENPENLVVLHDRCHNIIHAHKQLQFYELVRDDEANVLNGKIVFT